MADLPPELEKEMERLDKQFWVDQKKLKSIVKRFIEELEEGMYSFLYSENQSIQRLPFQELVDIE